MSQRRLRQKPRISYFEPDEPDLDEYIYCDKCGDLVYEYCSIHGPLLVIPDDKVPVKPNIPSFVPRAALTVPNVFLHISPSSIPGAGLGVFATLTLPSGVRFGPYTGERTNGVDSYYCWQIYDSNRKPVHCIDAVDANKSNWMRYVNCARHWSEQNLVAFQYQGQLYYRTIRIIPRFTELLVFYGSEFANELDIDLGRYNVPRYARVYGAPLNKTRKPKDENFMTAQEQEFDPPNAVSNYFNSTSKVTKYSEIVTEEIEFKNREDEQSSSDKNMGQVTISNNDSIAKLTQDAENDDNFSDNSKTPVDRCQQKDVYYFCSVCNKKYKIKRDLEKHMKFHDQKRAYACEVCDYRFITSDNLKNHNCNCHRVINAIICEICDKTFNESYLLKRHLKTHSGGKVFACDKYDAKFSQSNLKSHKRTHTGDEPFACGTCDAKFIRSGDLKYHKRTHTGEKPFACDTCDAKFAQSSTLKNHKRTRTREKPFACDTCDAKFVWSYVLKNHKRTHTGEKPFACDTCDAKFAWSGALKSHKRTHTGDKPFACDTCDAKFALSGTLKNHKRTHTGEKPFACDACDAKFAQSGALKSHKRTHTGQK